MNRRIVIACMVGICCLLPLKVASWPPKDAVDFRTRVLNRLFPLDAGTDPYFEKIAMRFSDSASQLNLIIYSATRVELVEYRVQNLGDKKLENYIWHAFRESPQIAAEAVAGKLEVSVTRTSLDWGRLQRWLKQLESVRISPALTVRIGVDDMDEYEFWLDTGQESVHYLLLGPPEAAGSARQDPLGKWMIDFRAHWRELVLDSSKPSP